MAQSGGRIRSSCPFADSRSDGCICIALDAPKRVSVDYEARFCLTERYVQCRRFQRAVPEIPDAAGPGRWSGEFELGTFLTAGAIALFVLIVVSAFTFRGTWSGWFGDQPTPTSASQTGVVVNAQPTTIVLDARQTEVASPTSNAQSVATSTEPSEPFATMISDSATSATQPSIKQTVTQAPSPQPSPTPIPSPTPTVAAITPTAAPAAATSTPPAPTNGVLATPASHVVAQGETLTSIARSYGVSAALIAAANNLAVLDAPGVGTTLMIPTPDGHLPSDAPILGVHVVATGDTLAAIASSFSVTLQNVMVANGISDANHIEVGQVLTIPKATGSSPSVAPTPNTTYTVQKGDTLYSISKRFGISIDALMAANGLTDRTYVQSGQVLVIPAS